MKKDIFSDKTNNKMSALPKVPMLAEVMTGVKRAQLNIFKPVTKVCMYTSLPLCILKCQLINLKGEHVLSLSTSTGSKVLC